MSEFDLPVPDRTGSKRDSGSPRQSLKNVDIFAAVKNGGMKWLNQKEENGLQALLTIA